MQRMARTFRSQDIPLDQRRDDAPRVARRETKEIGYLIARHFAAIKIDGKVSQACAVS